MEDPRKDFLDVPRGLVDESKSLGLRRTEAHNRLSPNSNRGYKYQILLCEAARDNLFCCAKTADMLPWLYSSVAR